MTLIDSEDEDKQKEMNYELVYYFESDASTVKSIMGRGRLKGHPTFDLFDYRIACFVNFK